MNDRHREGRPGRRGPGGPPARDRQGRWVRRTATAAGGAPDFVFDDSILEGTLPPQEAEPPFRLEGQVDVFVATPAKDGWSVSWAAPGASEEPPEEGPARANAGSVPRSLWLLSAALVGAGALLVAVQRGAVGPGTFAWLERRSSAATASEGPRQTAADIAGVGDAAARRSAPRVDRVVIPPVPPPLTPRPPAAPDAAGGTASLPEPPAQPAAAPVASPDATATADAGSPEVAPPVLTPLTDALAPRGSDEEDGWFRLAEEYAQLGDGKRAEELYRRIHEHGLQRGRAALALGDLLAARGDFQAASTFYRESTRLFQDRAELVPRR